MRPDTDHDPRFMVVVAAGVTTLGVDGELDLGSLDALARALSGAARLTVSEMVVDLSACRFLCSRSFGLIEAAAHELRERRARLVVRGQPSSFDRISATVGTYVFDAL
jgi:anti-anti-sigma factor